MAANLSERRNDEMDVDIEVVGGNVLDNTRAKLRVEVTDFPKSHYIEVTIIVKMCGRRKFNKQTRFPGNSDILVTEDADLCTTFVITVRELNSKKKVLSTSSYTVKIDEEGKVTM